MCSALSVGDSDLKECAHDNFQQQGNKYTNIVATEPLALRIPHCIFAMLFLSSYNDVPRKTWPGAEHMATPCCLPSQPWELGAEYSSLLSKWLLSIMLEQQETGCNMSQCAFWGFRDLLMSQIIFTSCVWSKTFLLCVHIV